MIFLCAPACQLQGAYSSAVSPQPEGAQFSHLGRALGRFEPKLERRALGALVTSSARIGCA